MDFGQAAILTFVFLGLVSEAKSLVWGTNKERITIGIVNVVAIIVVFLVAESAWGEFQVIGDQKLGLLDWASKLLVAIVLAGSASGLWQGFTAIKNVGVPMPTEAQKAALDKGAAEYAAAGLPDAGGSHTDEMPHFKDPSEMKP